MITINQINTTDINSEKGIADNSLDLSGGAVFVSKATGVIKKAVAGGIISWTNITQAVFQADNKTVAKDKIEFYPAKMNIRYAVKIAGGTVTDTSAIYFDLTDEDTVNGTTASATTGQLELVEFISATKWIFTIVNK